MERALKRAGKPVEMVYLDKADHYFSTGADRLAWLRELDKLFTRTIGSQSTSPTAAR
jgi:dipeptidyl aminopeptidase/acylaminoacyl peptidase